MGTAIYAPDVALERAEEQARRRQRARARAFHDLAAWHPLDYASAYARHRAQVYAEAGPLPGDDD